MVNVLATVLAVLAVVLFAIGLVAMTAGELLIAGLFFLSASLIIFMRETRAIPDDSGGE